MVFSIEQLFYQWEAIGVFQWVLPFLLIFAVVFGVLSATHILGGNKGVHVVIALAIGLLALRLGFVQAFFTELFPRFAIGLAVLLIVVIFVGLFMPKEHMQGWYIGLAVLGVIIGVGVIIATFDTFAWFDSFFWQEYWGVIIGGVILLLLIVFMAIGPIQGNRELTIPIPKFR